MGALTRARARAHTHTHTHSCKHACAHTHTHARAHTHTHTHTHCSRPGGQRPVRGGRVPLRRGLLLQVLKGAPLTLHLQGARDAPPAPGRAAPAPRALAWGLGGGHSRRGHTLQLCTQQQACGQPGGRAGRHADMRDQGEGGSGPPIALGTHPEPSPPCPARRRRRCGTCGRRRYLVTARRGTGWPPTPSPAPSAPSPSRRTADA